MKKRTLRSRFLRIFFLCFFISVTCQAQEESPLHNMDSLTEASHRQMLQRQAAEQAIDSIANDLQVAEQSPKTIVWPRWLFIGCVFVSIGAVLLKRQLRKAASPKD